MCNLGKGQIDNLRKKYGDCPLALGFHVYRVVRDDPPKFIKSLGKCECGADPTPEIIAQFERRKYK